MAPGGERRNKLGFAAGYGGKINEVIARSPCSRVGMPGICLSPSYQGCRAFHILSACWTCSRCRHSRRTRSGHSSWSWDRSTISAQISCRCPPPSAAGRYPWLWKKAGVTEVSSTPGWSTAFSECICRTGLECKLRKGIHSTDCAHLLWINPISFFAKRTSFPGGHQPWCASLFVSCVAVMHVGAVKEECCMAVVVCKSLGSVGNELADLRTGEGLAGLQGKKYWHHWNDWLPLKREIFHVKKLLGPPHTAHGILHPLLNERGTKQQSAWMWVN